MLVLCRGKTNKQTKSNQRHEELNLLKCVLMTCMKKNDSDIKDVWKRLFMTKGHERMQKRSGWEMLSKDLEEMSV